MNGLGREHGRLRNQELLGFRWSMPMTVRKEGIYEIILVIFVVIFIHHADPAGKSRNSNCDR